MARKEIIHLFVHDKCLDKCPKCCNKNFNIDAIPAVQQQEWDEAHTVCLTGGEPFLRENFENFVGLLRAQHPNIENFYVYTSGTAAYRYISVHGAPPIDGISFCPKTFRDWIFLMKLCANRQIQELKSNRLYVMLEEIDVYNFKAEISQAAIYGIIDTAANTLGCDVFFRRWIDNIESRDNEIFRRYYD